MHVGENEIAKLHCFVQAALNEDKGVFVTDQFKVNG